jgi:hypothetical protein
MKSYDALIRVSRMGDRKESSESTMTLDDQASVISRAIKEAGGRRGKTFEALDQSGFTIHTTRVYEQILDRVRRRSRSVSPCRRAAQPSGNPASAATRSRT